MTVTDRAEAARAALGVTFGASAEEVLAAHRRLVFEVHPDRISDPELRPAAEERLKEINAARDYLLREPVVPPAPVPPRPDPVPVAATAIPMAKDEGPMWPVYAVAAAVLILLGIVYVVGLVRGGWDSDRSPYHFGRSPFTLDANQGTETATALFQQER